MEKLRKELNNIIDDEGMVDYIIEAAEYSESVEDFKNVAIQILLDLDNVVSSEEEADKLAEKLFHLKEENENENENGNGDDEKMETPIKLNSLINKSDDEKDPFDYQREAMASKFTSQDENSDIHSTKVQSIPKNHFDALNQENLQFKQNMGFRRPKNRHPQNLILDPINVIIGPVVLIEKGQLKLSPGNIYGLVGRNGLGKTTLMKYIAANLINGISDDQLVVHVQQEAPQSERSVLQSVLDIDLERTELLEKLKLLEGSNDPESYNELAVVNQRLETIESDKAESRASTILSALGFSHEQLSQPLSSMSGGFRMRVSLAQALYIKPDVLLLDEPTGHLDAPSICWLEEFLNRTTQDQIVIVVSHDKVFLDNVCSHIIHLKDKKLEVYKGNWTSFHKQFESKVALLSSKAELQRRDIEHKMDFVRRLGVKAKTAALAQARLKNIAKMEKIEEIELDDAVRFDFPVKTEAAQPKIIELEDVSFSYVPGKPIFEHLNFQLMKDSRIVIIGANGMGKSTFIKLLMGNLKPTSGFHQIISNLRIAHFSQHHADQLDYTITPMQYLLNIYKQTVPPKELRGILGKFGLTSEQILQPIQALSGGQKSRVVLASIALMYPHLLLLDEVTNNLDMDSIEALGKALKEFKGAIVAITHDQSFANEIGGEIYICENKSFYKFDGTFQDYRNKVKEKIKKDFFQKTTNKEIV